jgi:oligo-alginate lyase
MIVPDKAGGWIHDYICPEHWEALSYVDGAHHCPQGHDVEGEKYDAAWCMYEHRRLADYAADSAAKGETTGIPILLDYAAKYAHYQHNAEAWMLTGHVMAQALTEAVWGQPITSAAKLLRPRLTPDEWQTVEHDLLCPLLETLQSAQNILVNERQKPHSNYNA